MVKFKILIKVSSIMQNDVSRMDILCFISVKWIPIKGIGIFSC